jgi:hypothetical protein
MKRYLWAGLLVLPFLLAVPSRAHAWGWGCPPCRIEAGANWYLRVNSTGPLPQLGPWYLYWPLEAHFGPPAPTCYPYWPQPMTLPTGAHGPGAPPAPFAVPPAQAAPLKPTSWQPVGYTYSVPNYWYGQ